MHVLHNKEKPSPDHCCSAKAIIITYSESVLLALVIQHAKRMRLIILSYMTCPAQKYSSALCHKRHDFWKTKKKLYIKYVF